MKITLTFKDIEKLIKDSYEGIINISEPQKDVEFLLEVDGDKFKRKNMVITPIITPLTKDAKPDYDKLLEEKAKLRKEITGETIIPEVKTLEEKNEEAEAKGLMTTGRGSKRVLRKT